MWIHLRQIQMNRLVMVTVFFLFSLFFFTLQNFVMHCKQYQLGGKNDRLISEGQLISLSVFFFMNFQ